MGKEKYKETLREKPDRFLLEIVLVKQDEYEPEAIEAARELLNERGVDVASRANDPVFIEELTGKQAKEKQEEISKGKITMGVLLVVGGVGLYWFLYSNLGRVTSFLCTAAVLYGIITIAKEYLRKWRLR